VGQKIFSVTDLPGLKFYAFVGICWVKLNICEINKNEKKACITAHVMIT